MKKIYKTACVIGALFAGCIFFINPNPFGNQPSVIADEDHFLTSAVKAIQDHTLPGWISDPTAAYYGGLLTYAIFFIMGLGGFVSLLFGAHVSTITPWIAYHWGDLIHLGRIINGLAIYLVFIWLSVRSFRLSKILADPTIIWFGFFTIMLLCGGSVFLPLVHTSKVWPLYIVIEIIAAWLVFSREWTIQNGHVPMAKSLYLNRLLLLVLLSWSQLMFGSLAFLWIVDALFLKHVSLSDLWQAFKRPFIWIAATVTVLLHLSFVHNFFSLSHDQSSLDNLSGNTIFSSHPWIDRIVWPWKTLWGTHPLLLILFLCAVYGLVNKKNSLKLPRIVFFHVVFVYFLFYLVLGFGLNIRYVLPLTVIVTFMVALSWMYQAMRWRKLVAMLCALFAMAVLIKTTILFWQPASVKILDTVLHQAPISTHALLIIKSGYFQIPVLNEASIQFTSRSTAIPVFRRFMILVDSAFKHTAFPFTISVGIPRQIPQGVFDEVWMIDDQDQTSCVSTKNFCFEVNHTPGTSLGTTQVGEGAGIIDLFRAQMIGRSYTLIKLDHMP